MTLSVSRKLSWEVAIAALLFLSVAILSYVVFTAVAYRWDVLWQYRQLLISGFGITVGVSIAALLLAMLLAIVLFAGQETGSIVLRRACQGYIELVRGTPLLVQVVVLYFFIAPAFQVENRIFVGIVALACFSSAYLAEIIRGGIESIANSQLEAAKAVGFTQVQTYRHVIVPQAVQRTLPAIAGEYANLIKNSALLSAIGVPELFKQGKDTNAINLLTIEGYVPLVIGYLLLTIPIALVSRRLERTFAYQS